MNANQQLVVALVLFNELQGTGLVAGAAVERVTQKQQYGLVVCEVNSLIDGMTEAALLSLIDVVEAFADVEDVAQCRS